MNKTLGIALGLVAALVALQLAQAQDQDKCMLETCGPWGGEYTKMCKSLCKDAGYFYLTSKCRYNGVNTATCQCSGGLRLKDTSDLDSKCEEMCPMACQSCGHQTGSCKTNKGSLEYTGACICS